MLSRQKAALLAETQGLAFEHYQSFLRASQCAADIIDQVPVDDTTIMLLICFQFAHVEEHADVLVGELPELSRACQAALADARAIDSTRKSTALLLSNHAQVRSISIVQWHHRPQVIDVLEIPLLMDTLVRKSMYDEALQLQSYVQRLHKKHHDIPIIQVCLSCVYHSL